MILYNVVYRFFLKHCCKKKIKEALHVKIFKHGCKKIMVQWKEDYLECGFVQTTVMEKHFPMGMAIIVWAKKFAM